jgi:nucleotide-binding universal stress UspA family protein
MNEYEGRQIVERERLIEQTEATMRGALRTFASRFTPTAECSVLAGDDVAATLVEHARERSVDVIAMASHVRSAVSSLFRVSVTQEVIRSGVAPVLITHRED